MTSASKSEINKVNEIGEKVFAFFKLHGHIFLPQNYRVIFDYYMDSNQSLTQKINLYLEKNKTISQDELDRLYHDYVKRQEMELTETQNIVLSVIDATLDNIKSSAHTTFEYNNCLTDTVQELQKNENAQKIKEVIKKVALQTQNTLNENEKLENQLNSAYTEITRLQNEVNIAKKEAMYDGLTGVINRKFFDLEIQKMVDHAKENEQELSLLMIDIDHFKNFNDSHGHLFGDQILKYVAQVLRKSVKGTDVVARYGGEEFSIILPDTPVDSACILANKLRQLVSKKEIINRVTGEKLGRVTVSIGATQLAANDNPEVLIDRADKALYSAKSQGRDKVISG